MRIALVQINFTIGELEQNADRCINAIGQAAQAGADLVVFSELSICGYIPRDMLNYNSFIERCDVQVQRIARHTGDIGVLIGAPRFSGLNDGRRLYNSALFLWNGELRQEFHKSLLPTYDVFDECRYFEPAREWKILEFRGERIAVTICEDLWNLDVPGLYPFRPMDRLLEQQPTLLVNLSGSPFSYNHVEERKERMMKNAAHYALPLVYVNQIGAHTEVLFDGGSMFIGKDGVIREELEYFREDFKIIDTADSAGSSPAVQTQNRDEDIELIHDALIMGIRDYFGKLGFGKAMLGSSGGIDSAVVHALLAEALGPDRVTAVMMPSVYSSVGSVADAKKLAENLNSPCMELPIHDIVDAFGQALDKWFRSTKVGLAEENIQARSRGVLLMALSNKFGDLLVNTSNKSETAVGYATLYGDMCGAFSPIGDLYKTQVYALANYINRAGEIIPESIITKAPSAELRPNQKDSDTLPPYEILDGILLHYIEEQKGWAEIIKLGYSEEIVRKVVSLVDRNEFKRFQASPIFRISHRAFGAGRQMPLVAKYYH